MSKLNIVFKKLLDFLSIFLSSIKLSFRDTFTMHYAYHGASLAFYTIATIVPLLVVITSILSILPVDLNYITSAFYEIFPKLDFDIKSTYEIGLKILVKQRQVYAITSFLIAYFFASNLFIALFISLKIMFNLHEAKINRLKIVLISIPILILALFLVYFGGIIINIVTKSLLSTHVIQLIIPDVILRVVMDVANMITFFTFFLLMVLIYSLLAPRLNKQRGNTFILSICISLIFSSLKNVFGDIINLFAQTNLVYGVFSSVFSYFAWIYIVYIVILFGARVLFYLEEGELV